MDFDQLCMETARWCERKQALATSLALCASQQGQEGSFRVSLEEMAGAASLGERGKAIAATV